MAAPKIAGTIRSKNPLKGAVEILPVSCPVDSFVLLLLLLLLLALCLTCLSCKGTSLLCLAESSTSIAQHLGFYAQTWLKG